MFARRLGLPVVHSNMVIEGGAVEVNGAGVLLQVEAMTMQRNPGWSRDSMEHELERVFGVQDIIWLKEGPVDDQWYMEPRVHGSVFNQSPGGHVDEFCRFVNTSTVLLAWPDDADLTDSSQIITRLRMAANIAVLERSNLHVVKVPTPDTEPWSSVLDTNYRMSRKVVRQYPDLGHGDTIYGIPAASYLNYVVTNNRVFVPAYWREGLPASVKAMDERVQAIIHSNFPGRTIVALDPRAINEWGGGMHCWTQQQPRP